MYSQLRKDHLLDRRAIGTRAHDAPLFKIKVPKVEAYKRAVEYAGGNQWNNLPADTRKIANQYEFKDRQHRMAADLQYSRLSLTYSIPLWIKNVWHM